VPILLARGTDFFALNLWVSVWGAAGILLFFLFLRARLGPWLAALVALLLWFNPGYQRLCNQVMSDVPGWTALVAVSCSSVAYAADPGSRSARARCRAGARDATALGNALLAPAIVLAWLLGPRILEAPWKRRALRAGVFAAGFALVLAPWGVRNRVVAPPPPADQTLLYFLFRGDVARGHGRSELAARSALRGGRPLPAVRARRSSTRSRRG
jgi:hypothetical protein